MHGWIINNRFLEKASYKAYIRSRWAAYFAFPLTGEGMRLSTEYIMNTREGANLISAASHRFPKQQSLYEPMVIPAGSIEQTHHRHLIESHFRRRHEQFAVKYGWEPITQSGMEYDSYDVNGHCDYALLIRRSDETVGAGCRLIRSKPGVSLPIQELLYAQESIPVGSIEISRMTNTSETAHSLYPFLGYLLGYLSKCGVTDVYMTIRKRLIEKFAHSGFDCYERLSGETMKKTNRNGKIEYFLPVRIGLTGYQQALRLLSSRPCV